jgi:hypothetical protein
MVKKIIDTGYRKIGALPGTKNKINFKMYNIIEHAEGKTYFDYDLNKLMVYSSGEWIELIKSNIFSYNDRHGSITHPTHGKLYEVTIPLHKDGRPSSIFYSHENRHRCKSGASNTINDLVFVYQKKLYLKRKFTPYVHIITTGGFKDLDPDKELIKKHTQYELVRK